MLKVRPTECTGYFSNFFKLKTTFPPKSSCYYIPNDCTILEYDQEVLGEAAMIKG